jgi:uncharacterized protein (DUF433 family)
MSLAIKHDDIPLTTTTDGVVVVTGTRVALDLIVAAFTSGATAEEIAQQYPTVQLADVYAAITYYLRHGDDVDPYIAHRREQAEHVRADNERRLDPDGVRDRLLARMTSRERDRVADRDPLAWEADGWVSLDVTTRDPAVP